eukprot:9445767-Alexandrium_andersonii.AAC.1
MLTMNRPVEELPESRAELHRRQAIGRRAVRWMAEDRDRARGLQAHASEPPCEEMPRPALPEGVPHLW